MNCGKPIKSGFFCARCQSGEAEETKKDDGWKGSRFTGEAKKRRQRQLLMEDLARWGKTLLILAVLAGVGYGVYAMFGDQIKAKFNQAKSVTGPREKYDPAQDKSVNDDDSSSGGVKKPRTGPVRAGRGSIDGGPG